jgi:hypothetical protein
METLARASSVPDGSLGELLLGPRFGPPASAIVVTAGLDLALATAILRVARRGQRILVIAVDSSDAPAVGAPGEVPLVTVPFDAAWWQRESLEVG